MPPYVRKITLSDWKTHKDLLCMVEIDVDVDRIARSLGAKALRNKSKRSKLSFINVSVRPCEKQGG